MRKSIALLFLFCNCSLFNFIPPLDNDAKQYDDFMQGSEIKAYITTINVLMKTLSNNFRFLARGNESLNIIPRSFLSSAFSASVSQNVITDPRDIHDLLKGLHAVIHMVYEVQHAIQFNLSAYLEKLASFTKSRPLLDADVKRTADEYYKKIEDLKKSSLQSQNKAQSFLFEIEGVIASRLKTFNPVPKNDPYFF